MLFFQRIHEQYINDRSFNNRRNDYKFELTERQVDNLEYIAKDLEKQPELGEVSAQQQMLEFFALNKKKLEEQKVAPTNTTTITTLTS